MSAPAAQFENVRKRYPTGAFGRGGVDAVRGVNLRVPRGEVFGLLGPNRAGKTTLIKMLLSLTAPNAGSIQRLGAPASDRSTLARVGYMHENHAFPRYLSAEELLRLYGGLSLIPPDQIAGRVEKLLKRVGLADRGREPIAHYSKGMVQRLGLAQALLTDPELLVLDEPTEGLDLEGRRLLRDVVRETRNQGRTVLLVSHVLSEVEQLCDRVGVLVAGRLAYLGPLAGLGRPLEKSLAELYARPAG